MNNTHIPNPAWKPEFTLDLKSASGPKFLEVVEAFDRSTKELSELPPLPFKANDWYTITAEIAEALLRRNRPGANRKVTFATVRYYYVQMHADQWPKTGQPIILTVEDILNDGQHRLWAAYLGLVSFQTYVIIDAPHIDDAFAYIDNVKPRNPAAALQTAGFNGLSPLLSQTIQVAQNVEADIFTCHKKKQSIKASPIEVLNYVKRYPEIKRAVHLTAGEYKDAHQLIGHKEIAAYVAFRIIALHGEEICDRFMDELTFASNDEAHPLKALRSFLDRQSRTAEPMAKHLVLAHIIKAFNAWINGTLLKRVTIVADDPFPQFVEAGQEQAN